MSRVKTGFRMPYLLLLILAGILTIHTALSGTDKVDIHNHDSYFIIHLSFAYGLAAMLCIGLWVIHWQLARVVSLPWLVWTHIVSICLFYLGAISIWLFPKPIYSPRPLRYVDIAHPEINVQMIIAGCSVAVLFLGQVAFVVHIITAIFKRIKQVLF
ncbi:hypothetical protein CJD36_005175 [Flavipsychrobacter stenotrophus]|uniref:Cytochrome C oxidase subunit I n=1 Tax=Flavipsychrobacter stenotrophus TaxID=2077091 RepID=A0A2S7SW93_9BACT|nr:hypothetical protein CJD36_005175 [Flavipsychrobacter stenotrophus]